MSYSLENQTNLIPKQLYGISSSGDVDISITSNGIVLGSDLTTTPITATITQSGLSSTNPNGLQVLSSLNMNQNDITNVASIIQDGNDLNINTGASSLDINIYAGSDINLNGGNAINLNAVAEMNFITPSGIWISTTTPNVGDGDLYANFYGNLNGTASDATNAVNAAYAINSSYANAVAITDNNTSATYYPTFVSNNIGNNQLQVDKTTNPLSYIPSTGNLTSTLFTGLLSTGGLVYLSTGTQSITGTATSTNISLTNIFNSTYKNYRIVLAPTTQLTFTAYPSYSLQAFLGTGTLPTFCSLYGFEMTSSATTIVSPVYTAGATISSSPLILAVSQTVNHQTIFEIENVGYTATTTQSIGLKCKSFYGNPGVSGASDRSITTSNISGSTITGLTLQQNSISVGNNMTIGWTIYGYK